MLQSPSGMQPVAIGTHHQKEWTCLVLGCVPDAYHKRAAAEGRVGSSQLSPPSIHSPLQHDTIHVPRMSRFVLLILFNVYFIYGSLVGVRCCAITPKQLPFPRFISARSANGGFLPTRTARSQNGSSSRRQSPLSPIFGGFSLCLFGLATLMPLPCRTATHTHGMNITTKSHVGRHEPHIVISRSSF